MPALPNAQHEKFVQELIRGKRQADAYLAAGYKAKSTAVASAAATRLLKDPAVQKRISEFQQKAELETALTLEEHMRELKLLREMAKSEGDVKAAITAEVKRGELRQFYVKRVEMGAPGEFEQLTDVQLQQAIIDQTRELAEIDPEFANELRLNQQGRAQPSTDPVPDCNYQRGS
jgi:phage terminase small subunit